MHTHTHQKTNLQKMGKETTWLGEAGENWIYSYRNLVLNGNCLPLYYAYNNNASHKDHPNYSCSRKTLENGEQILFRYDNDGSFWENMDKESLCMNKSLRISCTQREGGEDDNTKHYLLFEADMTGSVKECGTYGIQQMLEASAESREYAINLAKEWSSVKRAQLFEGFYNVDEKNLFKSKEDILVIVFPTHLCIVSSKDTMMARGNPQNPVKIVSDKATKLFSHYLEIKCKEISDDCMDFVRRQVPDNIVWNDGNAMKKMQKLFEKRTQRCTMSCVLRCSNCEKEIMNGDGGTSMLK